MQMNKHFHNKRLGLFTKIANNIFTEEQNKSLQAGSMSHDERDIVLKRSSIKMNLCEAVFIGQLHYANEACRRHTESTEKIMSGDLACFVRKPKMLLLIDTRTQGMLCLRLRERKDSTLLLRSATAKFVKKGNFDLESRQDRLGSR